MVTGAEIGMLIVGIMALASGKLKLGKDRVVYGTAARLLGGVALLPLPLAVVLITFVGMLFALQGGNLHSASFRVIAGVIEFFSVLICIGAIYGIGWHLIRPAEATGAGQQWAGGSSYAASQGPQWPGQPQPQGYVQPQACPTAGSYRPAAAPALHPASARSRASGRRSTTACRLAPAGVDCCATSRPAGARGFPRVGKAGAADQCCSRDRRRSINSGQGKAALSRGAGGGAPAGPGRDPSLPDADPGLRRPVQPPPGAAAEPRSRATGARRAAGRRRGRAKSPRPGKPGGTLAPPCS